MAATELFNLAAQLGATALLASLLYNYQIKPERERLFEDDETNRNEVSGIGEDRRAARAIYKMYGMTPAEREEKLDSMVEDMQELTDLMGEEGNKRLRKRYEDRLKIVRKEYLQLKVGKGL